MALCPKCGSANDEGAKFCIICGTPLSGAQPVQPEPQEPAYQQPQEPVYQQPQEPVYQQPQEPAYQQPQEPAHEQPQGPAYQQPQEPVYQQPQEPVYQQPQQPVYQQPQQPAYQQPQQPAYQQPQPVYRQLVQQPAKKKQKVKSNSMCTTGFVFSLLGVFLLGTTSLLGLIFSIIGLSSAKKKNQPGRGKAIAGIILALVMIALLIFGYLFLKDPLLDKYEELTGRTFPTRKISVEFDDMFEEAGWVVVEDETCLEFDGEDHTFKNYLSYLGLSDLYMTGHYELYSGKKAVKYLSGDKGGSFFTKETIDDIFDYDYSYTEQNLIALTCDYEAFVDGDTVQSDFDTVTEHFYGFYVLITKGDRVFEAVEMHNLEAGTSFTMIKEDQYIDYTFVADSDPVEIPMPDPAE